MLLDWSDKIFFDTDILIITQLPAKMKWTPGSNNIQLHDFVSFKVYRSYQIGQVITIDGEDINIYPFDKWKTSTHVFTLNTTPKTIKKHSIGGSGIELHPKLKSNSEIVKWFLLTPYSLIISGITEKEVEDRAIKRYDEEEITIERKKRGTALKDMSDDLIIEIFNKALF